MYSVISMYNYLVGNVRCLEEAKGDEYNENLGSISG